MSQIVLVLGVPHTPLLWRLLRDPVPGDLRRVAGAFGDFRAMLEAARPDVLLLIGSDHFRQFDLANLPAFLVGKGETFRVTHPNEERSFELPRREVAGAPDLARAVLGSPELDPGFDFAVSDEMWLDHSYAVPLLYLRPELDLPVIPVNTNANAPPIPGAGRFLELGAHLRRRVEAAPGGLRVAVVASGHLALELGGPRQFLGESPDPDFDREAVGWMGAGDAEAAVAACSYERLARAGNITHQFLNFLTALGAARCRPATLAEGVGCRFGSEPFFAWEAGG